MKMLLSRPARLLVVLSLACSGSVDRDGDADTAVESIAAAEASAVESRMRQLVVTQMHLELGLDGARGEIDPVSLVIERVPYSIGDLALMRVSLPVDHSRPHLVGVTGRGELLRLGRFPAPELLEAAEAIRLRASPLTDSALVAESRTLAVLADPNTAEQFLFPMSTHPTSTARSLKREWRQGAGEAWPPDTVYRHDDGRIVRVTIVSREVRSRAMSWTPTVLTFRYDSTGRLAAWDRRVGAAFKAASIPLEAPSDVR